MQCVCKKLQNKKKKHTHTTTALVIVFLQHNDESDDDEESDKDGDKTGDKESDKRGDKKGDKEGDKKGDKDSDNDESDEEDDAQAELLNGQAAVIVFTRATDAIAGRRRAAAVAFRFVLYICSCMYVFFWIMGNLAVEAPPRM